MNDVQDAVIKIVESLLEAADKAGTAVTPDTLLHGDEGLGLDSLQTAELSATLEDELGSDPFSAGEMPETVGEIVAFYARSA
ncbi:MAG TPA: phosphopantetheine-binding protein [Nocardioides sp.]|nr:phosphopantetheine-binding protein [Nocardioides sp.]